MAHVGNLPGLRILSQQILISKHQWLLYENHKQKCIELNSSSTDHMDLMQEYYTWQNPERANQFSYCQYPFILSIVAKQHILTKDSEQQASLRR